MESELMIAWFFFAALGTWIGSTKNRTAMGLALGFMLGIIGCLIIAVVPKKEE